MYIRISLKIRDAMPVIQLRMSGRRIYLIMKMRNIRGISLRVNMQRLIVRSVMQEVKSSLKSLTQRKRCP
jgi:hypothetical protein